MRSRKFCFSLISFTILASCDRLPWTDVGKARSHVAAMLIDPDSAKFKILHDNATAVCGNVDGKNRMGAYTGGSLFIYLKADASVEMYQGAPDYFDYDRIDSDSPSGKEAYSKLEDGCAFPEKWAKSCSPDTVSLIEQNEKVCKFWKNKDYHALHTHDGKYDF